MKEASRTHLVLIPSYNPGARVYETVEAARRFWNPVWIVVDASTDGTAEGLRAIARDDPGLKIVVLPRNSGKGAAVLHGIELAQAAGFTHVLTMDSDGQHPAALISEFMAASMAEPSCMVLGVPVFDASAPNLRVKGRRVSNWWANLETLWIGIGDSLFGFRVYPIVPLREVMRRRTSLIVSHRVSVLEKANRIVVLDHGAVADIGTHDELISREGAYRTAWLLQAEQPAARVAEPLSFRPA